jgi:hypothetical protein
VPFPHFEIPSEIARSIYVMVVCRASRIQLNLMIRWDVGMEIISVMVSHTEERYS